MFFVKKLILFVKNQTKLVFCPTVGVRETFKKLVEMKACLVKGKLEKKWIYPILFCVRSNQNIL